ncbi:hypothetical protein LWI28_024356 [Acer negundo]|uniref:Uncharacterized protein n=1 Tax=Acer negundo TaxID=4023 RepID=A0AAD5NWK1_ACENE|nr:hypothetical protein LWI28_024356 [Acer negundo]
MKEGDRAERIQGKEEGFKEIVQKKQKEVKEGWVEFDHRKQREPKESSFESNKEAVTLTVDCNRFNIEWSFPVHIDQDAFPVDFAWLVNFLDLNFKAHVPNDQFSNDGTESPKRKTFKNSNIDKGRKEASWKVKLIDKLVKMCFDRRAEFERSKGVREVSSGHEGGSISMTQLKEEGFVCEKVEDKGKKPAVKR